MNAQLALGLRLKDSASFENFLPAENAEAVECLKQSLNALAAHSASERMIYLWGAGHCGRTHLLQAVCRRAQESGLTVSYAPLREMLPLTPLLLDGLETTALVCIDDLQVIAGMRPWEEAVFTLAERLRARHGLLIVAADAPPTQLKLSLPDLMTRLAWGLVYPLEPLTDDEKLAALRLRAQRLGFELPLGVARYVLSRYPRDMTSLFEWLERVDRQALAAQRRITIPFLRSLEG